MDKHVVIVDFNHLIHTYFYSQHRLSVDVVNLDTGNTVSKDTTIQNGTIKSIYRWSNGGSFPTAVCFDRPCPARKAYFGAIAKELGYEPKDNAEYKGSRVSMQSEMFTASRNTEMILSRAGVSCYACEGYEADDIIMACVERAKKKYPGMHIDIITGDADMLALVDEQVSVYFRSKKGTFAEDKAYEKNKYIEVTPRNYSNIVGSLSDFKGFNMAYNTILLHKLIRGDKSDEYVCKELSKMYPATKWNAMIMEAEADGVDFGSLFRYGRPVMEIWNRESGERFNGTMAEAMASPEKPNLYQKITNPVELNNIIEFLRKYSKFSEEQLGKVEKLYWLMNLNMPYVNEDKFACRRAYVVNEKNDINTYDEVELKKSAYEELKISLK